MPDTSEELEHLNLVLRAVRNVNQLITHEKDRDRLLQGACDRLIETRGYYNVWIALFDNSGRLDVAAQAGREEEFAALRDWLVRGDLPRCGERALRQRGVVLTEEPVSSCGDCPLAKSYAGRSALSVRLEHDGHIYGLMSASISRQMTAEEERDLFREVAGDIAFALRAIELEEERHEEQERIKRSEGLFRTTLASIGDAVITTDVSGRVQYMNAVAEQLTSWGEGEAKGRPLVEVFNIINEDSRQIVENPVDRVLREGIVVGLANHTLLIAKGGREIPIADSGAPIREDNGKVTGVVLVFRDQTKSRKMQRTLEENERFLNDVFNAIQDGISVLDTHLSIRMVNWAMEQWYKESQPLVGKKCYAAYHGQSVPCDPCPSLRAMKSGKTEHNIVPGLPGSPAEWLELFSYPIKDPDLGEVTGVVEFVQDITERKRAEKTLEQERARAQTYLDVAAVAMVALNREGRITLVNRQGSAMLGYSEEELLGKDWFETCIPERLRGDVRSVFEQLMSDNAELVEHYENPTLTKDGEERIVAWHNVLLKDEFGKITGILSSGLDITKRRRAEEENRELEAQLHQAQKLESIGTLASGVAHEINNPLMGIINYADLIAEREKDAELRRFAQGIMKEGNRVAAIIKDLLYFARQEKESHSPARMEDIINASLTLVGAVLRKDQITIEIEIPEDLPTVRCRSQQIEQVIINLLTNARDALNQRYEGYHKDKLIRIVVAPFEKDGIEWVRTTIEDHGTGIQEDVRARIFDPFFTTKPRDVGTGLGLSVSYGIVQEHHGELSVESELGKYTRFHLDLRVDNGWNQK